MAFLDKLLHVLWRGPTGSSLEEAAASQEGHDGEHFCARSELKDWKEIRVVVTQDVAGDADGIISCASPGDGCFACLGGCCDGEVEAFRIVILQVLVDLSNEIRIVRGCCRARRWQGCHGCARDGELDPVANGGILGLACARYRPRRRSAPCTPPGVVVTTRIGWDFKRLIVRSYSSAFGAMSPTFGMLPMVETPNWLCPDRR